MFEVIKGLLLRRGPVPKEIFLGEVDEEVGNGEVVGNEPSVEIGKA